MLARKLNGSRVLSINPARGRRYFGRKERDGLVTAMTIREPTPRDETHRRAGFVVRVVMRRQPVSSHLHAPAAFTWRAIEVDQTVTKGPTKFGTERRHIGASWTRLV